MTDRLKVGDEAMIVETESIGKVVAIEGAQGRHPSAGPWVRFENGAVASLGQCRRVDEAFFIGLRAIDRLEAWFTAGGADHTTQLLISRTSEGYEIGFVRYGDLRAKTAKGSSFFSALYQAAQQLEDVLEVDAEPPRDGSI